MIWTQLESFVSFDAHWHTTRLLDTTWSEAVVDARELHAGVWIIRLEDLEAIVAEHMPAAWNRRQIMLRGFAVR